MDVGAHVLVLLPGLTKVLFLTLDARPREPQMPARMDIRPKTSLLGR